MSDSNRNTSNMVCPGCHATDVDPVFHDCKGLDENTDEDGDNL